MDIKLKKIFHNNGYEIEDETESYQLQLDSLQFISIMCDIETEFDINLSEDLLRGENLNTYNDFIDMIKIALKDERGV